MPLDSRAQKLPSHNSPSLGSHNPQSPILRLIGAQSVRTELYLLLWCAFLQWRPVFWNNKTGSQTIFWDMQDTVRNHSNRPLPLNQLLPGHVCTMPKALACSRTQLSSDAELLTDKWWVGSRDAVIICFWELGHRLQSLILLVIRLPCHYSLPLFSNDSCEGRAKVCNVGQFWTVTLWIWALTWQGLH